MFSQHTLPDMGEGPGTRVPERLPSKMKSWGSEGAAIGLGDEARVGESATKGAGPYVECSPQTVSLTGRLYRLAHEYSYSFEYLLR